MCECVKSESLVAGWICHSCKKYNGLQRSFCSCCALARCRPLQPQKDTGEKFETYEEAYRDDPNLLQRIKALL